MSSLRVFLPQGGVLACRPASASRPGVSSRARASPSRGAQKQSDIQRAKPTAVTLDLAGYRAIVEHAINTRDVAALARAIHSATYDRGEYGRAVQLLKGYEERHGSTATVHTELDEANYPELLGHIFVLNAPWVLDKIWQVVRGRTPPATSPPVHRVALPSSSPISKSPSASSTSRGSLMTCVRSIRARHTYFFTAADQQC